MANGYILLHMFFSETKRRKEVVIRRHKENGGMLGGSKDIGGKRGMKKCVRGS